VFTEHLDHPEYPPLMKRRAPELELCYLCGCSTAL